MASIPEEQSISLQLGDIIEITSPADDKLNGKQFFIKYLDKERIEIIEADGETMALLLNEDGSFQNESIESIAILSRAESPSYARQHNLIPGQWIDIHFGGELPSVITGNITGLDEDQIEIKILEGDTIYIDFAYKGIPEDIPIEKIVLREPPQEKLQTDPQIDQLSPVADVEEEDEEEEIDGIQLSTPQEDTPEPAPAFKERVKNIILAADQDSIRR